MKKTFSIPIYVLLLSISISVNAISDIELRSISDGFTQRRDDAFKTLTNTPLVVSPILPPLATGRPDYSRGFAYSLVEFSFKCFWLNEQNDEANAALVQYADYYISNYPSMYDPDSFYWSTDELCRIIEYYGSKGSKSVGLLNATTENKLYQLMWLYTKYMSKIVNANYNISETWYILNSENHDIQGISTLWQFSKLLKESSLYKDSLCDDGFSVKNHYTAWNGYVKYWLVERAKKGLWIEMNNETYGFATIKGIYNIFDFGDSSLRDLAKKILDLHWAAWAQEQIDGAKGGAKNRVYSGNNSQFGLLNFGALAWYYLGIAGPTTLPQNFFTFASSEYRMPYVVMDIALDIHGRGVYEITQRTLGLAVPGYSNAPYYRVRLDSAGISRYSYCTPDFIIGSAHFKARPNSDWLMISSQNRWQGVIFDGDLNARIFPQCSDNSGDKNYNAHWSAQKRGCLITQKLTDDKYALTSKPMKIFFSSAGLSNMVERSGWVFVCSKGAYAALKCVSQGYTWAQDTYGQWLMCQNQYTPIILQVVQKSKFENYQQFQDSILAHPITYDGKTLRYRSIENDDFIFYTDYSQLPVVNSKTVELEPNLVYNSPFITSVYNSGVININKDNRRLKLDFTVYPTTSKTPIISYGGPYIFKTGNGVKISPQNTGGEVPITPYGNVTTVAATGGQPFCLAFNKEKTVVYMCLKNINTINKLNFPSTVSLLAGTGSTTGSFSNGTGALAGFNTPYGIAVHPVTGEIYVADQLNNRIRKITQTGVVSTFAGSGISGSNDGLIGTATFSLPTALAFNEDGTLYVLQNGGGKIRKIDSFGTTVSTLSSLVGGNGANPTYMTYYNGYLYVSELNGNKVDKVNIITGAVTLIAGSGTAGYLDGIGATSSFNRPCGIAVDSTANVYIADYNNCKIRKISSDGVVSTIAGSGTTNLTTDGIGIVAGFRQPTGLTLDNLGNLYVGDAGGSNIRKICVTGYTITPSLPEGLIFDSSSGEISGIPIVETDATEYTISAFNKAGGYSCKLNIRTTATLPPDISYPTPQRLVLNSMIDQIEPINNNSSIINSYTIKPTLPTGLNFDSTTGIISGTPTAISDKTDYQINATSTSGSCTSKISLSVGYNLPLINYNGPQTFTVGVAINPLTPTNTGGQVPAGTATNVTTPVSSLGGQPHGLAINSTNTVIYAVLKGTNKVSRITLPSSVSDLAGNGSSTGSFADGVGSAAGFNTPIGVAIHPTTGEIYVADQQNNRIRKITTSGIVSTYVGTSVAGSTDGNITLATLNLPTDVAFDSMGNLFILESNKVRKVDSAGATISTLKSGISGTPISICFSNGYLFISENTGNKIDRLNIATGELTTLAGCGGIGSFDGVGISATFNRPRGIVSDAYGNVYVADYSNNSIRMIGSDGEVTTLAGNGASSTINGIGMASSIWAPASVEIDGIGNLFVGSAGGNNLRKISLLGFTIKPNLPSGLYFDSKTGTISGTPIAESASTNYKITGYNIFGSNTSTINLTVKGSIDATQVINEVKQDLQIRIISNIRSNSLHNIELQILGNVGNNALARLYDMQGRILLSKNIENPDLNIIKISNIRQGIYLLRINYNSKVTCLKVIF